MAGVHSRVPKLLCHSRPQYGSNMTRRNFNQLLKVCPKDREDCDDSDSTISLDLLCVFVTGWNLLNRILGGQS